MDLTSMKPEHLGSDELRIECEIRQIVGDGENGINLLKQQLEAEGLDTKLVPKKLHRLALKSPQAELSACIYKLQHLQIKLLQNVENSEITPNELDIINSRLLHLLGRTSRIATIPHIQLLAEKLQGLVQNLIQMCEKIGNGALSLDESRTELHLIQIDPSELIDSLLDIPVVTDVSSHVRFSTPTSKEEESINIVPPELISNVVTTTAIEGAHFGPRIVSSQGSSSIIATETRTVPSNVVTHSQIPNLPNPNMTFPTDNASNFGYPPWTADNFRPIPPPFQNVTGHNFITYPVDARPSNTYINQFSNLPPNIGTGYNYPTQPVVSGPSPGNTNKPTRIIEQSISMDRWKLTFNGTDVLVDQFIFQVEHLAKANYVSEPQLVNGLHMFLKGLAWDHYWAQLQQNSKCTWQNLKSSLMYRFKIRRSDLEIRQTIDLRKQKFNESFIEFYYSILELAQPLTCRLTELEILDILKKNMRRELKIHLAGQFINTISDLLSICTNVEDVWRNVNYLPEQQGRFRPPPRINAVYYEDNYSNESNVESVPGPEPNISSIQVPRPSVPQIPNSSYKTHLFCWNCQRKDHSWKNCDIPTKIFCFGCGTPNVLRPHCPSCSREGNVYSGWRRPGFHPSQMNQSKPQVNNNRTVVEEKLSSPTQ